MQYKNDLDSAYAAIHMLEAQMAELKQELSAATAKAARKATQEAALSDLQAEQRKWFAQREMLRKEYQDAFRRYQHYKGEFRRVNQELTTLQGKTAALQTPAQAGLFLA